MKKRKDYKFSPELEKLAKQSFPPEFRPVVLETGSTGQKSPSIMDVPPGRKKKGDWDANSLNRFTDELCRELCRTGGFSPDMIDRVFIDEPQVCAVILISTRQFGKICQGCGIYVMDLYKNYLAGASMKQIVDAVLGQLQSMKTIGLTDRMAKMRTYEGARDSLFIRAISLERIRGAEDCIICKKLGDIALVVYMDLGSSDTGIVNMKLPLEVARSWEKDPDELFREALLNTCRKNPPRIYHWLNMMLDENYEGVNFMDPLSEYQPRNTMHALCLSTLSRVNGAVAVFFPGVARRISELLGGSFYMAFTSIHEVMIHREGNLEVRDIQEILAETMKKATPDSDVLSSSVYRYDQETEIFSMVA